MIPSGKTSDDIRGSLVPKDVILLARPFGFFELPSLLSYHPNSICGQPIHSLPARQEYFWDTLVSGSEKQIFKTNPHIINIISQETAVPRDLTQEVSKSIEISFSEVVYRTILPN